MNTLSFLFLFFFNFLVTLQNMWDLSSRTWDQSHTLPALDMRRLNYWTSREVPEFLDLVYFETFSLSSFYQAKLFKFVDIFFYGF